MTTNANLYDKIVLKSNSKNADTDNNPKNTSTVESPSKENLKFSFDNRFNTSLNVIIVFKDYTFTIN